MEARRESEGVLIIQGMVFTNTNPTRQRGRVVDAADAFRPRSRVGLRCLCTIGLAALFGIVRHFGLQMIGLEKVTTNARR